MFGKIGLGTSAAKPRQPSCTAIADGEWSTNRRLTCEGLAGGIPRNKNLVLKCLIEISHFFAPPNRFDHKLFDRIGCVTARSPGIWHDAGHLYTVGPRMCVGILSCLECCFDIFLFSETWRVETEEIFVTPVGHKMFFSGGHGENWHQGVGVAIHKRLLHQIDSISFSAISSRVCQLQLSWGTTCFRCIAVYFPTSWHSEDEVEHVYTLLDLLLDACVKDGCIPILGGDFNACIGPLENHEAMDQIGHWGSGIQNERGRILMRFVLAKGLQICNRQSTTGNMEASWTCCRTLDGTCVQLDYILANFRLQTVEVWNDFTLPIGLDHRCAHCISHFQWCSRPRRLQHRGLKWWQPNLDSNGLPAKFQAGAVAEGCWTTRRQS